MIQSGYIFDLECDCFDCAEDLYPPGAGITPVVARFQAQSKGDSVKMARLAGWKLNTKSGNCAAPGHTPKSRGCHIATSNTGTLRGIRRVTVALACECVSCLPANPHAYNWRPPVIEEFSEESQIEAIKKAVRRGWTVTPIGCYAPGHEGNIRR